MFLLIVHVYRLLRHRIAVWAAVMCNSFPGLLPVSDYKIIHVFTMNMQH